MSRDPRKDRAAKKRRRRRQERWEELQSLLAYSDECCGEQMAPGYGHAAGGFGSYAVCLKCGRTLSLTQECVVCEAGFPTSEGVRGDVGVLLCSPECASTWSDRVARSAS